VSRNGTNSFQPASAIRVPPANTRASGRARAVAYFQDRHQPYVINWDSIAHDSRDFLVMGDPFETYNDEVRQVPRQNQGRLTTKITNDRKNDNRESR